MQCHCRIFFFPLEFLAIGWHWFVRWSPTIILSFHLLLLFLSSSFYTAGKLYLVRMVELFETLIFIFLSNQWLSVCGLWTKQNQHHLRTSNTLWPHGLFHPWNSPGQDSGVGSLSLLQGIFPTQGLNSGLPHCRQILHYLSHKGSPRILEWVACPFSNGFSQPRNWTRVSCTADGFFPNCAIGEAWELVRNANSQGLYQTCWSKNSGAAPGTHVSTNLPWWLLRTKN